MTYWPTIPIKSKTKTKKGDLKGCTYYYTIFLISHISKIMFRIIQWRLKSYMKKTNAKCSGWFLKKLRYGMYYSAICWDIENERIQKNKLVCASLIIERPLFVSIISSCGICLETRESQKTLLSSCKFYTDQKSTVWTECGRINWL